MYITITYTALISTQRIYCLPNDPMDLQCYLILKYRHFLLAYCYFLRL
jgi:hypothetical protein